jgi:hypothetical protein
MKKNRHNIQIITCDFQSHVSPLKSASQSQHIFIFTSSLRLWVGFFLALKGKVSFSILFSAHPRKWCGTRNVLIIRAMTAALVRAKTKLAMTKLTKLAAVKMLL